LCDAARELEASLGLRKEIHELRFARARRSLFSIVRGRVLDLLARAQIDEESVLAVVEAGSTAHAISVGSDDLDCTVIHVETFDELVVGDPNRPSLNAPHDSHTTWTTIQGSCRPRVVHRS
jgi:hypothetical protein